MPEEYRREKAFAAASKYAPRPEGSALTYGLVAVVLAVLAVVIFGMFYSVNAFAHPTALGLSLVAVFTAGVLLRRRRRRLHGEALAVEFGRDENSPAA